MPLSYFQDTPHEERLTHLRAILAARASGRLPSLDLRDGENRITFIRPNDHPGLLAEVVGQLPHDRPLISAKIHSANDASLAIDTFEFGEKPRFDISDPEQTACMERAVAFAAKTILRLPKTKCVISSNAAPPIMSFRSVLSGSVSTSKIFRELSGTEGTIVRLEQEKDERYSRIVVAVMNASTRRMLERVAERLAMDGIDIFRAYLDSIDDGDNGQITLLGFVVQREQGVLVEDSRFGVSFAETCNETNGSTPPPSSCRTPTPDLANDTQRCWMRSSNWPTKSWSRSTVGHTAGSACVDGPAKTLNFVKRSPTSCWLALTPTTHFPSPTSPCGWPMSVRKWNGGRFPRHSDCHPSHARRRIGRTRRTNVFLDERYGLAFRIDPAYLHHEDRPALPFGVFFVRGRNFAGFHVRFRDIAARVASNHSDADRRSPCSRKRTLVRRSLQLGLRPTTQEQGHPGGWGQGRRVGRPVRSPQPSGESLRGFSARPHHPRATHQRSNRRPSRTR